MALEPGTVFAGYVVERLLGVGGMGSVYLVSHPRLPRRDALKLLRPELCTDPVFVARFRREAAIVAGLSHPHILPVHDRGSEGGQLWISMPYVEGRDAEDELASYQAGMPAARAVEIVGQVGSALDYAHRTELLHRDVKPANILLTAGREAYESEWVFLTDFGIAKATDEAVALTETGAVLATFGFASPEQIEGRRLDARADIYSLGCVLYKLLTGSNPYPGTSVAVAIHGHLQLPPPRPTALTPGLPVGFDEVVAAAMAKAPGDRYESCRALTIAARNALSDGLIVCQIQSDSDVTVLANEGHTSDEASTEESTSQANDLDRTGPLPTVGADDRVTVLEEVGPEPSVASLGRRGRTNEGRHDEAGPAVPSVHESVEDLTTGHAGRRRSRRRRTWWTVGVIVAATAATGAAVFALQPAPGPCAVALPAGSQAAGQTSGTSAASPGTLWAWGIAYADPESNTVAPTPTQIPGLTEVTAAAGFVGGGYALKADGTVWAWGAGEYGQLGNGAFDHSSVPVRVSGLTGATAISAASTTGFALLGDGTVWAWGLGGFGELGTSEAGDRTAAPVRVAGLADITAIAGDQFNNGYALRRDGTVWAWGYPGRGQLGDGGQSSGASPVQVTGLTDVTAVAAAPTNGYALRRDGTVWAWGDGSDGALGTATEENSLIPVQVPELTSVTSIAAGGDNAYALRGDGTVCAWGDGDGKPENYGEAPSSVPVQIPRLDGVTALAAGRATGYALQAGQVWGWGDGRNGQLGDDETSRFVRTPRQVPVIEDAVAIAGAYTTGYAITE
jgi:serine/threonine protein kinase/alpha-tubulin suppressor-like RCC1 family protein